MANVAGGVLIASLIAAGAALLSSNKEKPAENPGMRTTSTRRDDVPKPVEERASATIRDTSRSQQKITRVGATLTELNNAGAVDGVPVEAEFGSRTIAGEIFDSVSTIVYRDDRFHTGSPWITIKTQGRYSRIRGVVGIRQDAECSSPASMTITDAERGRTLWGPERITISTAKRFDVPISGLIRINLVGRSLAENDDVCGGGQASPTWGDVEFIK